MCRMYRRKMRFLILAAMVFGTIGGLQEARSSVSFVRDCRGRDPGVWEWGEGADGCDADRFGSVTRIKTLFSEFVFDRSVTESEEAALERRKDYVTNVNALLRDLATKYIRERAPNTPEDEVAAFVLAIQSVAHQETFWSHYRIGEKGGYKLSTGDRNISHGMMQINQRYHASREQDRSFDIVGNVSFGIEHFYNEWETALHTRCVMRAKKQTREQTLENVSRAAYSAYNGGPGSICRWTNSGHAWAKNDRNFYQKLKAREWREMIRDADHKLKINLDCARAGDDLCAVAKERRGEFITSRPLLLENGSTCVTTDGSQLMCAKDLRVFTCLAGLSSEVMKTAPLTIKASDRDVTSLPQTPVNNRLELCQRSMPDIATIGDVVTLNVGLPVKNEVGGRTIGFTKKGQSFQVLDVDFEFGSTNTRQYRIRFSGKLEGWISGGDAESAAKVASVSRLAFASPASVVKGVAQLLPAKGGSVQVAKIDGTSLLAAPEIDGFPSTILEKLAKGTNVTVEDVQIFSAANEIWLKVQTPTQAGFIYAGRTFPSTTIDQWVTVRP